MKASEKGAGAIAGAIESLVGLENAMAGLAKVFDPRMKGKGADEMPEGIVWSSKSVELALEGRRMGQKLIASPFYRGNDILRAANITFQYTEEELLEFYRCEGDIEYFADNYVKLKTAEGVRNIKLRPHQRKWIKSLSKNRFNIGMWSRQSNKTTTTAIFFAHYTIFNIDKCIAILAQKDDIGSEVFSKVKLIIENLPFFLKPGCLSYTKSGYDFDNGCRAITRPTAPDCLQGYTVDAIYIDEFAFLKRSIALPLWINVFPTISSIPDGKCIITSTPNGKNLFYELWMDALSGKNPFKTLMVKWYELPGRDDAWKAEQISILYEEGFAQNYDLSFDTTMRNLLKTTTYAELTGKERPFVSAPLYRGDFAEYWRWESECPLNFETAYAAMSVDVGEGVGGDYSVIKIRELRFQEDKLVLALVGIFECNTIKIKDFARVVLHAAGMFDQERLKLVVETNGCGQELMGRIDDLIERTGGALDIEGEVWARLPRAKGRDNERGLRLNTQLKKIGASAYIKNMDGGVFDEPDALSLAQVKEFGKNERGIYKAISGHDDLVMPDLNLSYYMDAGGEGWADFLERAQAHAANIENGGDSEYDLSISGGEPCEYDFDEFSGGAGGDSEYDDLPDPKSLKIPRAAGKSDDDWLNDYI